MKLLFYIPRILVEIYCGVVPHFLSPTLIQQDACVQLQLQPCEQALIMSSQRVMIGLFLPFCLCPRAYLHASSMGRRACLYRSFLVSRRVSAGPEELCLIV